MNKTAVQMIEDMRAMLDNAMEDAQKVDKGQKASRTRLRKTFMNVINQAKDNRKEILSVNSDD